MTNYDELNLPLGKRVSHVESYDPNLLARLRRPVDKRITQLLGSLSIRGFDLWTAHEVTWLDELGKPRIAELRLNVPCTSPYIIESKSMKLYLESFAFHKLSTEKAVLETIESDIQAYLESELSVELSSSNESVDAMSHDLSHAQCLDDLKLEVSQYRLSADDLQCGANDELIEEEVCCHVLRSLCPVTGQPDYATVRIRYRGKKIDHRSLLRYLIGYRKYPAFHELIVERIFADILQECSPEELTVHGSFARRGGIDIALTRSFYSSH